MLSKIIFLLPFCYTVRPPCSAFSFCFFCFVFAFLFHLLFLSLTLIISIFYCLNYTSLLLRLITTHLISHIPLSFTIFSISALIIENFYFAITSSFYNTPCKRFYNNYVINICPRQFLRFI